MNTTLPPERRSEILFQNIAKSDCGVIALQAITGLKRETAERLAVEIGGYTPEEGTPRSGLDRVLGKLSVQHSPVAYADIRGVTAASFAMFNEYGRFLVYTPAHVMALIDGDLLNSRSFFHDPVEAVTKIGPDDCVLSIASRAEIALEKAGIVIEPPHTGAV
jgi:hypothetical protein